MPLPINPNPPEVMHVDMNACFARAEQQAHPLWRGKPVGVVPINVPGSCVISPSYELKAAGAKTAMRIRDVKLLSPNAVLKQSDPELYREVHRQFCNIFQDYSADVVPKSIDEAVIYLHGCPALKVKSMEEIGRELKERIYREIGGWMSVNVGIGCNAWQAKTAASLHKPNGMDRVDATNLRDVLAGLQLTDLCGINTRYEARLNEYGIFTPLEFLDAEAGFLCRGPFGSIEGYYWYRKLRGFEEVGYVRERKSFGNSVTLGKPVWRVTPLSGVIQMLALKASTRMRREGFGTCSIQLSLLYADRTWFMKHVHLDQPAWTVSDLFRHVLLLFNLQKGGGGQHNAKGISKVMVDLTDLKAGVSKQCSLFEGADVERETGFIGQDRERRITEAMDAVNFRYGSNVLRTGSMAGIDEYIWDRIPFGSPTYLEELYAEREAWPIPIEWE